MTTTLITADQVLTLDASNSAYRPGGVLIDGERIAAVGPQASLEARTHDARIIRPTTGHAGAGQRACALAHDAISRPR